MELNIRKLKDTDYNTLFEWWSTWKDWTPPSREFLPENGTGGFIVEKNNKPIVAGFIYYTNSKAALLEWIVSDPSYRDSDREDAIELLINASENVCKTMGYKYVFTIGRNKKLIDTHKKLKWNVDEKPSHEIVKIIN